MRARVCATLRIVHTGPHDVARFQATDSEELVLASFACPACLHSPERVRLRVEDDGALADCVCSPCGRRWTVVLDGFQALRLTLAPPAEIAPVTG